MHLPRLDVRNSFQCNYSPTHPTLLLTLYFILLHTKNVNIVMNDFIFTIYVPKQKFTLIVYCFHRLVYTHRTTYKKPVFRGGHMRTRSHPSQIHSYHMQSHMLDEKFVNKATAGASECTKERVWHALTKFLHAKDLFYGSW